MIYACRRDALSPAGRRRHGASQAAGVPALVERLRADGLRTILVRIDLAQERDRAGG